jgi:hypothetical protein
VRSNFARIGITALLVLGSVGCHGTSAPTAPETKAVSEVPSKPTIASDCVPPEGPVDRPGHCSYPADVRDFIDMRDACDHWRGEPWPDHQDDPEEVRKKQILEAIKESCTGTDKRLSALKVAYASDPKILQVLDEYEIDIESDD